MGSILKIAAANPRTTAAGIIAAVIAILDGVMKLLDGDPATNPEYAVIIALVLAAIGLIRARDDVVTSTKLRDEGVLP